MDPSKTSFSYLARTAWIQTKASPYKNIIWVTSAAALGIFGVLIQLKVGALSQISTSNAYISYTFAGIAASSWAIYRIILCFPPTKVHYPIYHISVDPDDDFSGNDGNIGGNSRITEQDGEVTEKEIGEEAEGSETERVKSENTGVSIGFMATTCRIEEGGTENREVKNSITDKNRQSKPQTESKQSSLSEDVADKSDDEGSSSKNINAPSSFDSNENSYNFVYTYHHEATKYDSSKLNEESIEDNWEVFSKNYVKKQGQSAIAKLEKQTKRTLTNDLVKKESEPEKELDCDKIFNKKVKSQAIVCDAENIGAASLPGYVWSAQKNNSAWHLPQEDEKKFCGEDACFAHKWQIPLNSNTCTVQVQGVCDGHGGFEEASFVAKQFQLFLKEKLSSITGNAIEEEITNACAAAIVELDALIRSQNESAVISGGFPLGQGQGTTLTASIIFHYSVDGVEVKKIFIPNVGDSRTILVQPEATYQLTEDASLKNPVFLKTVDKIKVPILNRNRDNTRLINNLQTPRDIGGTTPRPKFGFIEYASNDEKTDPKAGRVFCHADDFLISASDGIWDVMTNEEVGDLVREGDAKGYSLATISAYIVEEAQNRWLENEEKNPRVVPKIDDCTIIITKL